MTSLGRRDRGALAGLLAVALAAALVSTAVDHRRGGGPVLPSAQAAARVESGRTTSGAGDTSVGAIVDRLLGGGGVALPTGSAAAPAVTPVDTAGSDAPPPDEAPEVPTPPLPLVPGGQLPPEVRPLTQLAAPVGAQACQYLGLLPLAAALGGALGSAAPVSLADLLPYMKPLFDTCLVVGVPDTQTSCQLDQQIDDGADLPPVPVALGLTVGEVIEAIPIPTPMGVFIDEIAEFEHLVLGPPKPGDPDRFSDRLAAALTCSQQ